MADLQRAPTWHVTAAALLLLVIAAPGSSASRPASGSTPDALAELRTLIGDGLCVSDDQCRTIAIGAGACGGPERYLAWSTLKTDEKSLRKAAAAYPSGRMDTVRRGGAFSTCRPLVDPGAHCATLAGTADKRHCTLRAPRSGATAVPDR